MKYLKYFENRYDDILKSYGKEYIDLENSTIYSDDETGSFAHLPSPNVEKLLKRYYHKGSKLLDIGCGFGNILRLSNYIGYESTGIEINEKLSKYHKGLNVIYGDILNMNLNFIKEFDIIYLYRPIEPLDKCDKLFDLLYDNMKDSCKIIYLLPHDFSFNHIRKFNFLVKNKRIDGIKINVLKKIKGVKDINVGNIISKLYNKLNKFKKTENKIGNYVFVSFDGEHNKDNIKIVKNCDNLLKQYNIDLDFRFVVSEDRISIKLKYLMVNNVYHKVFYQ